MRTNSIYVILSSVRFRQLTYVCFGHILVIVAKEDLDGHSTRIPVQFVLLAVLVIYQVAYCAVKFFTLANQLLNIG